MEYGYCRISTPKQNIERQERNIKAAYPDAHIVKEVYTGTKTEGRKELEKILRAVQPGDVIIFDSVSRMSRNATDGVKLYENLFDKGIELIFIKEPHINTSVYREALEHQIDVSAQTGDHATDTLINSIIDALKQYQIALAQRQIEIAFEQAEKEVTDLHQRTAEGIQTARLNGKQIGQRPGTKLIVKKKAPAMDAIKKYSRDFDGTLTDAECIKLIGIARNTYYRYKRELGMDL